MKKKYELEKVEPVKIKSLFGMKPGKWLTILYLIIIVLAIFLIGFLPGILKGQMRVSFTSPAGNAAVYIDGSYAGGTPFTTWVSSGTHEVEFQVYGNTVETSTLEVGHPLFLTWVFPRNMSLAGQKGLDGALLSSIYSQFLTDIEAQSAVTAYDTTNPYPPLYTDFAEVCTGSNTTPDRDVMSLAFAHISCLEMLEDARTAAGMLGIDYDFSAQSALFEDQTNAASQAYLENQRPVDSLLTLTPDSLDCSYFKLDGQRVCTGDFVMGEYQEVLSYEASVSAMTTPNLAEEFSLASAEITEYQYALFLKDNPEWAKDNIEELKAEGLVDDFYLSGISTSLVFPSNKPVRNISYYAAEAFCRWASELSGKNVFLPTEIQWSAAFYALGEPAFQRTLLLTKTSGTLDSMLGGVWEMTGSAFVPMKRMLMITNPAEARTIDSELEAYDIQSDMIIKGGCYISSPSTTSAATIGYVTRSECSEIIGFRVAWN